MTWQNGQDLTFTLDVEGTPTSIGGLQVTGFQLRNELLASDLVTTDGWRSLQNAGERAFTLTLAGLVEGSSGEDEILSAALANTSLNGTLQLGTSDVLTGSFLVEQFTRDGAVDEPQAWEVTLQSANVVTRTIQ